MTYKVMIVDDQNISRKMFSMYIENSGRYELVHAVESAMFADTYVLNRDIDLVLMDILMGDGSSGLEAAAKIKKIKPEIKIIAVTSMPEVSWLDQARAIGIESFWYKEATEETILSVMDRTMAGESVYPDSPPNVQLGLAQSSEFTQKELEVLRLLTTGATNQEIAEQLGVSENTIKTHVKHLLEKTGYEGRVKLAIQARITGMVIDLNEG